MPLGASLKGKEFSPCKSKFFPLREALTLKELHYSGKQTKFTKVISLC